ncbi:DUF4097 family beta strand repeat-containing protein [Haloactinomyces albus]|uniref:DUF4097 domain-containing protein n=1 Tax=Haloactinomyces albus TaxID=1352928 RepID=A0AAE4CLB2_9ACTN|nr:DUF4097 family beta strand repeat-containing protein [Haloactinomyces albus]MDR7302095.1 hypothetical protein [Haloactinomyces albus]
MARTGLAVGGVLLILAGISVLTWGGSDSAEVRTTALGDIRGIEIDSGSGSVDVRYEPGAEAVVQQREHRWWGGWWADDSKPNHSVADGELLLDTHCGWNCTVDYVVTLPKRVPVTGELGSGSLGIAGMSSVDVEVGAGSVLVREVSGPVTAHTGSGGIELVDIAGNIEADTGSGSIEGRDLRGGDITAHTSSGGVTLDLLSLRSVDVDSGSGRIELTVPRGPYRVDAETGSGSKEIDVGRAPAAERSLTLSTGSGGIHVDRA